MSLLDKYQQFQSENNPEQEERTVSNVMVRPVFGEYFVTLCYDDGSFAEMRRPTRSAALEFAKKYVDEAKIIW